MTRLRSTYIYNNNTVAVASVKTSLVSICVSSTSRRRRRGGNEKILAVSLGQDPI